MRTAFRTLLGVDLLILAFALWQCVVIATSSLVSQTPDGVRTVIPRAPGETWLMVSPMVAMMGVLLAVLAAAMLLHRRGRTGLAMALLLVPAVPVVLGGLLTIGLMILFTLGTPSH